MEERIEKEKTLNMIKSLRLYPSEMEIQILYTISNHTEKFYIPKKIKKRNGQDRQLYVPKPILKQIQKNILKNVLSDMPVSSYAKAYVKNCSLKENVKPHVNKQIVLKLDIEDFFDSITFEKIYAVFPKEKYSTSIRTMLAHLVTYFDALPQGAPTSPYLSNLVMKHFDEIIGAYCEKQGISYTRYCDDLTFSGDFDYWKLKKKVSNFLNKMGFVLNEKKTKVIKQNNAQLITGLVVNEKINVQKEVRKRIRQEMYYIKKYGLKEHAQKIGVEENSYKRHLLGQINYCIGISPTKEFIEYKEFLRAIE